MTDPQDIPYGYCHCGCGGKTKIIPRSDAKRGYVKGEPFRFLGGHFTGPAVTEAEYVVDEETGCWLWQLAITPPAGHGQLTRNGKNMRAHRYYYERLVGPIPRGMHLHHRCEVPRCVNPAHLEPLTPAEHRIRHQSRPSGPEEKECPTCGKTMRQALGETRSAFDKRKYCGTTCSGKRTSKLTAKAVQEIRTRAKSGVTQTQIGREFGISQARVSDIVRRKTWAEIP